jgi:hypothetical protein
VRAGSHSVSRFDKKNIEKSFKFMYCTTLFAVVRGSGDSVIVLLNEPRVRLTKSAAVS